MQRLHSPVALAAACVLIGCHEPGSAGPVRPEASSTPAASLTAEDRRRLKAIEGRIQTHCVDIARSLVDPSAAPTAAEEARAFAAADDFIALTREKPTALVDVGQDLRLFLADVIENLEGANCDERMVGRLERGLVSIPNE